MFITLSIMYIYAFSCDLMDWSWLCEFKLKVPKTTPSIQKKYGYKE
jgi:hypothetical protein